MRTSPDLKLIAVLVMASCAMQGQSIVALSSTPTSVVAGMGTSLLVTCQITDPNVLPDSVLLQRLDGASNVTGTFGNLRDNGQGGDLTAGDLTFAARFSVQEQTPGMLRLRVSAGLRGSARRVLSGVLELPITGTATSVRILAPARDAYLSLSPVVVRGQLGDPSLNVTVNGIPAAKSGLEFTASVPLIEGTNTLTAVAIGNGGASGSDSVQVVLDTTAPRVTITSPTDGFRTTESALAVSGIVNDIVVGTVNPLQATVTVNGLTAQVSNRTFSLASLPLVLGPNTIRAEGRDRAGNTFVQSIVVTRDAPVAGAASLRLVSGNNQSAPINGPLPAPLVVQLLNASGQPSPNTPVTFRVVENNGLVNLLPAVIVNTDGQGRAQVAMSLGSRSGAGGNRVEAFSTGFAGTALFTASGTPAGAAKIVVDSGLNQTGATGRTLPFPFVAVVTDAGNNRLAGVPVTFSVRGGGGSFNSFISFSNVSDSDGRVMASLTLGLEEGVSNNVVEATFAGNPGQPAVFSASALTPGPVQSTTITGVVQDNSNQPIPNVTIRLFQLAQGISNGQPLQIGTPVTTDAQGFFRMTNAPVGTMKLMADGSTALPSGAWPTIEYDLVTVAGRENGVGSPIYLPRLDQVNRLCVTATTGGTLTLPQSPGFSLTVAPGSATFPGGSRSGCISVTPVNPDKVPMVPGFGQQPRFVVTIQPVGTMFNPPAQITIPNVDGLAPRAKTEMYSYDHDLASFVAIGTGSVTADGSVIASDPGVGVLKAGWHCGGNPNPTGTAATCSECQRCQGASCVSKTETNVCCQDGTGCCRGGACEAGVTACSIPDPQVDVFLASSNGACFSNHPLGKTVVTNYNSFPSFEVCRAGPCQAGLTFSRPQPFRVEITLCSSGLTNVVSASDAVVNERTWHRIATDMELLAARRAPQCFRNSNGTLAHEQVHAADYRRLLVSQYGTIRGALQSARGALCPRDSVQTLGTSIATELEIASNQFGSSVEDGVEANHSAAYSAGAAVYLDLAQGVRARAQQFGWTIVDLGNACPQ
jgi:hypothetical protein